jgi:sulfatase maturation enzyme AslB (radical SAM superfamily)
VVTQLILTVTRACNLRCSYCPTAKDGWPSLDESSALRALDLFCERWGGGDVKLFGGEPLLVPHVVRAVINAARENPKIRRVYLSTNGLPLDAEWLSLLRQEKKLILTLSLDGRAEDNRRHRRALPNVADAYDHVQTLLPELVRMPRTVVTQTIAPSLARVADQNFQHLLGLGFTRFNFLPGYYIKWRSEQLAELAASFDRMHDIIVQRWRSGGRLYVRNLFTLVPTPFFNTGVVVDSDGSIHPNNLGLSGALEELLPETRVGTLDAPPSPELLEERAKTVNSLLQAALPEGVWDSTLAVDRELTRFCQGLYGEYAEYRRRRRAA